MIYQYCICQYLSLSSNIGHYPVLLYPSSSIVVYRYQCQSVIMSNYVYSMMWWFSPSLLEYLLLSVINHQYLSLLYAAFYSYRCKGVPWISNRSWKTGSIFFWINRLLRSAKTRNERRAVDWCDMRLFSCISMYIWYIYGVYLFTIYHLRFVQVT